MSFLFKNRKNKQFNFKSVYYDPLKEDGIKQNRKTRFAKEMYAKWDRIPFSKLKEQGKKNVLRFLVLIVTAIITFIYVYEEIETYFRGIE